MGYMRSTWLPNLELFSERTSSIKRKVKLKDIANFLSFFLRGSYSVRSQLQNNTEKSWQEEGILGSHWNTDSLLKNSSSKCNKCVVKFGVFEDHDNTLILPLVELSRQAKM